MPSHNIHFVGSLGLLDAETAFRTQAELVGGRAKRYTDGEHGPRQHWIRYQTSVFDAHPDLELAGKVTGQFGGANFARPYYYPRDGIDVSSLKLGPLGYANEAIASFAIFSRLKSEDVIPEQTKFQVSLPTPVPVIWSFIREDYRATFEPVYEAAMLQEVAQIVAAIPSDQLAIQWDVCQEVLAQDGALNLYYDDKFDGTIIRIHRLAQAVPESVELGFHLCYGDPGHKHIQEPVDLGTCVRMANSICQKTPRPIHWFHMPVPRERTDEDYFAPLSEISLPPKTELSLGLVHHTDGLEGTRRRMQVAKKYRDSFSIATECGFGRRDLKTINALFKLHAQAAEITDIYEEN